MNVILFLSGFFTGCCSLLVVLFWAGNNKHTKAARINTEEHIKLAKENCKLLERRNTIGEGIIRELTKIRNSMGGDK